MKCKACDDWILEAPYKHNQCGHVSMCNDCYNLSWKAHEELEQKNAAFNHAEWVAFGSNYTDYPHQPAPVKCLKCFAPIRNKRGGFILLEWENKRYKAHLQRTYTNKKSKAGKGVPEKIRRTKLVCRLR